MKGDCNCDKFEVKERRWKEAITGKINTLKEDLFKKNEEVMIYKERLREIENAFYHNLNLITDRDLQLDALEKELNNRIEEHERLLFEKNEMEQIIRKMDEERLKTAKLFECQLTSKDEEIYDLEKKNKTNVNTLKRTIEDIKLECDERNCKLVLKFENEKKEMENRMKTAIGENNKRHSKEMHEMERQVEIHLDNANRMNEKLMTTERENENLKAEILKIENEFSEKEKMLLHEIEQTNNRCRKINKELQEVTSKSKIKKQMKDTETAAKPVTKSSGTVTETIFNWKPLPHESNKETESVTAMRELKQSNKKLEHEIMELKKMMNDDRIQRNEDETIIQNLEMSVSCLKEKLYQLRDKFNDIAENCTEEEIITHAYNKEIQNQIQVTLLEHQFNKKLEILTATIEEEKRFFYKKFEEMKQECLNKLEQCLKQQDEKSNEINGENLLRKIRLEIDKLENKIEKNVKILIHQNTKCDKNVQVGDRKSNRKSDSVIIVPDWIVSNQNSIRKVVRKEKHLIVQKIPTKIQKPENLKNSSKAPFGYLARQTFNVRQN